MNLRISTKLWLPTLAMLGMLVVMATGVSMRTRDQIELSNQLQAREQEALHDASTWAGLTAANAARAVSLLLASDTEVEKALKPEIDATSARISALQKHIEELAQTAVDKAALAKVAESRKAYIDIRNAAMKLKAAGDVDGARALMASRMRPAVAAYLAHQEAFVELQRKQAAEAREASGRARMATVWGVVGLMSALIALMAVGTVLLVRSICGPLAELATTARRIGEGELDVAVDTTRGDELGDVLRSLAAMRDALRGIVGRVRESAESIQTASAEVAAGNTDLSQRTELAASNLQQTASSIEQLTGNVRQSADAASQANQLAASASAVATRGGQVVAQVVSTMDEINASSKRIADIIGTIDGIAFQTNILALNAAVEAARAGEQGRGFAVVAGEVRSLAQRSAEAAREIKTLIGSSVERVATGARLVQDAGTTMGEIVTSVQRVSDIIGEISAASGEQSQGIFQVNAAVSSLDQMTQQNAALVEQSAAAAESLREQAIRLSQAMQVFRLSGEGPVAAPEPTWKPPAAPSAFPTVTHRPAAAAPRPAPRAPMAAAKPSASRSAPANAAPAAPAAAPAAPVSAGASDDWETF